MVQTRRAVIYARVSTDDQDTARQVEDLTSFAQRCGYEIVAGPYTEKESGVKNDRKERAKVMQLAKERKIDCVLVTELTRWGRSTEDLLATVQELADRNVSLITLNGMEFDLTTPMGKMMLTFIAGIAEFERGIIIERVRSGIAKAKRDGKHCGRPALDSDLKTRIADHLEGGKSVREVARLLNCSPTTVQKVSKEIRKAA